MSWNGATEVSRWALEGAQVGDGKKTLIWEPAGEMAKQGFESGIELARDYDVYRLTALTATAEPLGVWIVRPDGLVTPIPYPPPPSHTTTIHFLVTVGIIFSFFTASTLLLHRRKARLSFTPLGPLLPRFSRVREGVPRWARFWDARREERRYPDGGEEEREQEMRLLERDRESGSGPS